MKNSVDVKSSTAQSMYTEYKFQKVRGRCNHIDSMLIRFPYPTVRELVLKCTVRFLDGTLFEIEFSRIMREPSDNDLMLLVLQCYMLNQFPFDSGVDFQIALGFVGDSGFSSHVIDQL